MWLKFESLFSLFAPYIIKPSIINTTEYTKAKKPLEINKSDKKYNPYKNIIGIKKFINEFINWSFFIGFIIKKTLDTYFVSRVF